MRKVIAILVLGLLFISIDLSNPTTVKAASFEELEKKLREKRRNRGFFKKQWDKLNLNPVTYFEKRKECKEGADMQDTVYDGKEYYKDCMEDQKTVKKKKNKKKGIVLYNLGLIIFILGCIVTLYKFVIYPLFLD